jgi:type I restriction enzyme R subunit
MVICDSSEQAKEMFKLFGKKYAVTAENESSVKEVNDSVYDIPMVAENTPGYEVTGDSPNSEASSTRKSSIKNKVKRAALILHDIGTKEDRKNWVEDFKAGKIDFVFVYNMLLTGFNAKRLKKLYLGRLIRAHNLLQALTRVNRTYKDFRYGYVVDFADIRKEFDETNKRYFDELQAELGDELEAYSNLFKSQEEIEQEIEHVKDMLFRFDTENAEIFADQISQIQDRETVLALKKALENAKSLYNLIRLQGDYELLEQLDFAKLNILYRETSNHLDMLNLKASIEQGADTANLLNVALEEVVFRFIKVGEEELVLADQLKNTLCQAREALASNFDQQDPKFVSLKEELERLFKKKNLSEVTQEDMVANIDALNKIHARVKELNRQNNQLRQKYLGDAKYTRIHKRLQERGDVSENERKIFAALTGVKQDADEQVLNNTQILDHESYFERQMMPLVINRFMDEQKIKLNPSASDYINHLVVTEYLNEFHAGSRGW